MKAEPAKTRHSILTRLAHMGLALAVGTQLLTSLVIVGPSPGKAGDVWYDLHEYGGLTAFGFVLMFWVAMMLRRRGTEPALLFPWLSRSRLAAVWNDVKSHASAMSQFRLPPFEEHGPLASGVHGLGLLLMTAMAATGTLYYFVNSGNPDGPGLVGVLMFVHKGCANLVWAYLIGHAGLAVLHHYTDRLSLAEMWSLRGSNAGGRSAEHSLCGGK